MHLLIFYAQKFNIRTNLIAHSYAILKNTKNKVTGNSIIYKLGLKTVINE